MKPRSTKGGGALRMETPGALLPEASALCQLLGAEGESHHLDDHLLLPVFVLAVGELLDQGPVRQTFRRHKSSAIRVARARPPR